MTRMIVIVDDYLGCAEPLQIALEALGGLEVVVADDARSALKILAGEPGRVAAVITDWRMPFVSGQEFLRAVRGDAALGHVPVLVVSGDSDPALPARALSSGAAAFFSKPYSPLEIRRRLEQLLA